MPPGRLVNAQDPMSGDAGFTAVLTGENFRAAERRDPAVDAVIPTADVDAFASATSARRCRGSARAPPTSRTPRI
jgi:hypothetical protein